MLFGYLQRCVMNCLLGIIQSVDIPSGIPKLVLQGHSCATNDIQLGLGAFCG